MKNKISQREICTKIINKLFCADVKLEEIETVAKMVSVWATNKDSELAPVIELLNVKIADLAKIIRKF